MNENSTATQPALEKVIPAEAELRGAFVEDAISLSDAKASASDLKDLPRG